MSIPGMIAANSVALTHRRATVTRGSMAQQVQTPVDVATLTGWVQPASADTLARYGARNMLVTHTAYFSADPSLQLGDLLVVGSTTYKVDGVRNQAGMDRLWSADLEEVR